MAPWCELEGDVCLRSNLLFQWVIVVVKSSVLSQRLREACQQISDNLQANVSAWNQRGKEQYVVEQVRPHTAESLTRVDPKNGE